MSRHCHQQFFLIGSTYTITQVITKTCLFYLFIIFLFIVSNILYLHTKLCEVQKHRFKCRENQHEFRN